ncbi:hypothetical protein CBR_g39804 [Chara braunii]|uniref:DUF7903 domain-containing protein n=1 Tax=Chara braunii TaxID=69332 RepID=A0A388LSD1_CHABU|nr:hypothetical protein CBR_g39804 [Chara braunii]|eukprot:GBG85238.1 hypothetical protein CBR_g39804 [Chara braunii]
MDKQGGGNAEESPRNEVKVPWRSRRCEERKAAGESTTDCSWNPQSSSPDSPISHRRRTDFLSPTRRTRGDADDRQRESSAAAAAAGGGGGGGGGGRGGFRRWQPPHTSYGRQSYGTPNLRRWLTPCALVSGRRPVLFYSKDHEYVTIPTVTLIEGEREFFMTSTAPSRRHSMYNSTTGTSTGGGSSGESELPGRLRPLTSAGVRVFMDHNDATEPVTSTVNMLSGQDNVPVSGVDQAQVLLRLIPYTGVRYRHLSGVKLYSVELESVQWGTATWTDNAGADGRVRTESNTRRREREKRRRGGGEERGRKGEEKEEKREEEEEEGKTVSRMRRRFKKYDMKNRRNRSSALRYDPTGFTWHAYQEHQGPKSFDVSTAGKQEIDLLKCTYQPEEVSPGHFQLKVKKVRSMPSRHLIVDVIRVGREHDIRIILETLTILKPFPLMEEIAASAVIDESSPGGLRWAKQTWEEHHSSKGRMTYKLNNFRHSKVEKLLSSRMLLELENGSAGWAAPNGQGVRESDEADLRGNRWNKELKDHILRTDWDAVEQGLRPSDGITTIFEELKEAISWSWGVEDSTGHC